MAAEQGLDGTGGFWLFPWPRGGFGFPIGWLSVGFEVALGWLAGVHMGFPGYRWRELERVLKSTFPPRLVSSMP